MPLGCFCQLFFPSPAKHFLAGHTRCLCCPQLLVLCSPRCSRPSASTPLLTPFVVSTLGKASAVLRTRHRLSVLRRGVNSFWHMHVMQKALSQVSFFPLSFLFKGVTFVFCCCILFLDGLGQLVDVGFSTFSPCDQVTPFVTEKI